MPVHVSWDYSKSALMPRHCSRCGNIWSFRKDYRSAGSDVRIINIPTEEDIKAGVDCEINHDLRNPVINVFCPKCGEMAQQTIDEIFPNGFKDGLIRLYKGTLGDFFSFLIVFISNLFLSILMGAFGYSEAPEWGFWGYVAKTIFLLIHWVSSAVVIVFLYYWLLKMMMKKKVAFAINALTEEEAYQMIKKNMEKDIRGGFGMVHYLCPQEVKKKKFFIDRFLNEKLGLTKRKAKKTIKER